MAGEKPAGFMEFLGQAMAEPTAEERAAEGFKQIIDPIAQKAVENVATFPERNEQWVKDLQSPDVETRRAANAQLIGMGAPMASVRNVGAAAVQQAGKAAGSMALEHYSNTPNLQEISPKFAGSGIDARTKGRGYPVSYFYKAGTEIPGADADKIASMATKYRAEVDPSKVYDIAEDPAGIVKGLMEKAKDRTVNPGVVSMEDIIKGVKDAGYEGHFNSADQNQPNTVVRYLPTKVAASAPAKAGFIAEPHFIMTAENPRYHTGQQLTNEQLVDILKKQHGVDAELAQGKYGEPEGSVVVKGVTPEKAEELHSVAELLGQESGLHSTGSKHEMRFYAGPNAGKSVYGEGTVWHKELPKDYYTQLGSGEAFTHNLNFDEMKPSGQLGAGLVQQEAKPMAPAFFSNLQRVAEAKLPNRASPQQIMATLKDVKPEELKYSGLQDFLAGKEKVTKQEILEFLKNNPFELKEVVSSEAPLNMNSKYALPEVKKVLGESSGNASENMYLNLKNDGDAYRALTKKFPELANDEDWADLVLRDMTSGISHSPVQYRQYSLPGGSNYREKRFTLPDNRPSLNTRAQELHGKKFVELNKQQRQEIESQVEKEYKETYKSSHWPNDSNVLFHSRQQDFVDASGAKVLHLDEIQSDWHKEGGKKGYKGDVRPLTEIEQSQFKDLQSRREDGLTPPEWDKLEDLELRYEGMDSKGAVPDAPFKKNWHELALKKALREAAEGGYDKLSWSTGEQNAAHYNLSKKIDNIQYNKNTKTLFAEDKEGQTVIDEKVEPEKLADYIGKEAAEKLMKPESALANIRGEPYLYELSGANLDVGGEGMKKFYDEIIPQFMNKYTKKWGGRVETSNLPASLFKGQFNVVKRGGSFYVFDGDKIVEHFKNRKGFSTKAAAENYLKESVLPEFQKDNSTTVHSITITPAMRAALLGEGQAMYAEGGEVESDALPMASDPNAINYQASGSSGLSGMMAASPAVGQAAIGQPTSPKPPGFDNFIKDEMLQANYGTPGQQAIAGAEAFGRGALGPLVPLAESGLGVSPEAMRMREEANPATATVGEIAGFGTSLAAGFGVGAGINATERAAGLGMAKLAEFAGKKSLARALVGELPSAAGELATIAAAKAPNTLEKIGSIAAKQAVSNAVYQMQSEVSRMVMNDPDQSVGSALMDIGMAGLFGGAVGGAFGSIHPMWKAAEGIQTDGVLRALARKAGGIENVDADAVKDMFTRAGIKDVPPEVMASLMDDQSLRLAAKTLEQSDTTASDKQFQETLRMFKKQLEQASAGAFGKTLDEVSGLSELSKYETGKTLGKTLAGEYQKQVGPMSEVFEGLKEKFKDASLFSTIKEKTEDAAEMATKLNAKAIKAMQAADAATSKGSVEAAVQKAAESEGFQQQAKMEYLKSREPGTVDRIVDRIQDLAQTEGWSRYPDGDIMGIVDKVTKNLPNIKTLDHLNQFISNVGKDIRAKAGINKEFRMDGGKILQIMRDEADNVIERRLGEEAPDLLKSFQDVRSKYREQSLLKEALDDRLHTGATTHGFGNALNEMAITDGESVLSRLSGKGDADLLNFLSKNYPETAKLLKSYHADNLLKAAMKKAKGEQELSPRALLTAIEGLEPELRNFAVKPEAQAKLKAIGQIMDEYERTQHNYSNTARTLDKLFDYVPGTAVGIVGTLASHNPALGAVAGYLTKVLGKDIPDKMRLSLLRFMGSDKPIDAGAFKAMTDFFKSALKGDDTMTKAVKGMMRGAAIVIPDKMASDKVKREKLDKWLTEANADPSKVLNVGGQLSYYMPEAAQSMSASVGRAVAYVNSQRPGFGKQSPLDSDMESSAVEKAAFNRTLDIAQQPMTVLEHMKNGTLTPKDMADLKAIHPGAYQRMVNMIQQNIHEANAEGITIPYKLRMGLSIFLNQPLDSTFTPQAIMAAQPLPPPPPPTMMSSGAAKNRISKMPGMTATIGQGAAMRRASHK